MKKYITPNYEREEIETKDVITVSCTAKTESTEMVKGQEVSSTTSHINVNKFLF